MAKPAAYAGAPFLREIYSLSEKFDIARYPFIIPVFSRGFLNAPEQYLKHLFANGDDDIEGDSTG
jgi:hypothetical protein